MSGRALLVTILDGNTNVPQEVKDTAGEYSFVSKSSERPYYTSLPKDGDKKKRWIYWAEGAWWIGDDRGIPAGVAWATSDAIDVPETGWVATTGWFGSTTPMPLCVLQKPSAIQALITTPRPESPVAKQFNNAMNSSKKRLSNSFTNMKASYHEFVPKAERYSQAARGRLKAAASECHAFMTHPDTVHCLHATKEGLKDVALALCASLLSAGFCICECIVEIVNHEVAGKSEVQPWWELHNVRPEGANVETEAYKGATFSQAQQEQFGVNEIGEVTDQAAFDKAIEEIQSGGDRAPTAVAAA